MHFQIRSKILQMIFIAIVANGCFLSQAKKQAQREQGGELKEQYNRALQLGKKYLFSQTETRTPAQLKIALENAAQCERKAVDLSEQKINDAGTKVYENPLVDGFIFGDEKISLANSYLHCKLLREKILSEGLQICRTVTGSYLSTYKNGNPTPRELKGMSDWSEEDCILKGKSFISPESSLSDAEIKKVKAICKEASQAVYEPKMIRGNQGENKLFIDIRCEKSPQLSKGKDSEIAKAIPVVMPEKCKVCKTWIESNDKEPLKPSLEKMMKQASVSAEDDDE